MKDLSIRFINKTLVSPLVLASGILGTEAKLLARVAETGVGAVTTKSCGFKIKPGHENPTVLAWDHGLLNAVGLSNPGVDKEVEEINKLKSILKKRKLKTKIIASFFGLTMEEFVKVAKKIIQAKPDFLEMNISCPNIKSEVKSTFAVNPVQTFKIIKAVKKVINDIPLIVKLSPNVTDIVEIAQAAEDAGADAINAINTLFGMVIDIESGRPILTNKMGGLSGPAIKPVAVRCVYQISQKVKIPVIGLGGVSCGNDAIEMMMAGATAVGVGSAVYQNGISVFNQINKEIKRFMRKHQYESFQLIKGKAW